MSSDVEKGPRAQTLVPQPTSIMFEMHRFFRVIPVIDGRKAIPRAELSLHFFRPWRDLVRPPHENPPINWWAIFRSPMGLEAAKTASPRVWRPQSTENSEEPRAVNNFVNNILINCLLPPVRISLSMLSADRKPPGEQENSAGETCRARAVKGGYGNKNGGLEIACQLSQR